ncbi:MAG: thermonuclease family protein, partial [Bacilli bacterium]|nr:thermonuclease family protein [Bacilli bacterium]
FIFFLILIPINIYASNIKDDSIIYCNNNYYGIDKTTNKWYVLEKKNNEWNYDINNEVLEPSCNNRKLIEVKFNKCIDGDTVSLFINGKKERARLLAIDTPESVTPEKPVEMYGKEASDYTCNLVKNAKLLQIEYDHNSDKKDKYDRPLVYLYADNKMVQKELLKKGYAKVSYLYGEYKYTEQLKMSELEAKEKGLGIWNEDEIVEEKEETIIDIIFQFLKRFFKGIIKYAKNMLYFIRGVYV